MNQTLHDSQYIAYKCYNIKQSYQEHILVS